MIVETGMPVPPCLTCKHYRAYPGPLTCDAFAPKPIPADIIWGRHDHKTPYEGDHGIVYAEGEPKKEPDHA